MIFLDLSAIMNLESSIIYGIKGIRMTSRDKIEEKIMRRPIAKDITFTELKNFLVWNGFTVSPGKGDHVKFEHDALDNHLSIPCGPKTVNAIYIKQVQLAIHLLETNY